MGVLTMLGLLVCGGLPLDLLAAPMATAFSYHGKLTDGGALADGVYDFQFALYDHAVAGAQQGTTISTEMVPVAQGQFTVVLDFGAGAFAGGGMWLDVSVRPGGSPESFTPLTPRQPLRPVPYAVYAGEAAAASAVPWSAVTGLPPGLADGVDNVGYTAQIADMPPATDTITQSAYLVVEVEDAQGTYHPQKIQAGGVFQRASTIFVDAAFGADASAHRSTAMPYRTLKAAAAELRSGDTLLIRPGTLEVACATNDNDPSLAPVYLEGLTNISIIGSGPGTIIWATNHGNVLVLNNCTNVLIRDVWFKGAGSGGTGNRYFALALSQGTTESVTVRDCWITDSGAHGIAHLWGNRNAFNWRIEGCRFARIGNTDHPILRADGAAVALTGRGLMVLNSYFDECFRGVEFESGRVTADGYGGLVSGCVFTNILTSSYWSGCGVILLPTVDATNNLVHIAVRDSVFYGDPGASATRKCYGVRVDGGKGISVAGCRFSRCTYGIGANQQAAPLLDFLVADCQFHGCIPYPLSMVANNSHTTRAIMNVRVNNCIFDGENIASSAVLARGSQIAFSNCDFRHFARAGLSMLGSPQHPGNDFLVDNCRFAANVLGWSVSTCCTNAQIRGAWYSGNVSDYADDGDSTVQGYD